MRCLMCTGPYQVFGPVPAVGPLCSRCVQVIADVAGANVHLCQPAAADWTEYARSFARAVVRTQTAQRLSASRGRRAVRWPVLSPPHVWLTSAPGWGLCSWEGRLEPVTIVVMGPRDHAMVTVATMLHEITHALLPAHVAHRSAFWHVMARLAGELCHAPVPHGWRDLTSDRTRHNFFVWWLVDHYPLEVK